LGKISAFGRPLKKEKKKKIRFKMEKKVKIIIYSIITIGAAPIPRMMAAGISVAKDGQN
jgi:hypothetical protein